MRCATSASRRPLSLLLTAHNRARRLTDKTEKVSLALLRRLGPDGQCHPSQATLAADAGCDERTVRRANDQLHALGLLRWHGRIIRSGARVVQTSNAYILAPEAPNPAVCTFKSLRITETNLLLGFHGQNVRRICRWLRPPRLPPTRLPWPPVVRRSWSGWRGGSRQENSRDHACRPFSSSRSVRNR